LGYLSRFTDLLIGQRIGLPDRIVRAHPDLSDVKLRRGGIMPRIGGLFLGQSTVEAITLWRTIYFGSHASVDADILLHELRHVQQFLEHRSFPVRYIWESLRRGYHQNRYEVDARSYAARRLAQASRVHSEDST
jgi:hypothetical protein